MTRERVLAISIVTAVVGFLVTLAITLGVRGRSSPAPSSPPVAASAPSASPSSVSAGRKIKVRLYYVSTDGTKLTAVDHEVAYGDGMSAQARQVS